MKISLARKYNAESFQQRRLAKQQLKTVLTQIDNNRYLKIWHKDRIWVGCYKGEKSLQTPKKYSGQHFPQLIGGMGSLFENWVALIYWERSNG